MLRKKAQEHRAGKQAYEAYVGHPPPRDPGKQDILLNLDESENYLRFVFNATIVFAVTVLDDLLKSLTPVLGKTGNRDLVARANAIIQDRSPHLAGARAVQPKSGGPSEHDMSLSRCALVSWRNRKHGIRSDNGQTNPFWTSASQYWSSTERDV
jgi:hypothetical protein